MSNFGNIDKIVAMLKTVPEVTKSEAMSCMMTLCDKVESEEDGAIESVMQVVGFACANDHPEQFRRFIKYVAQNGPINVS